MSIVTFCGHSDFYGNEAVMRWLRETVEALIQRGAEEFLLGGYGGFDASAASVVRELKEKYPSIRVTLVLAYLDQTLGQTVDRQTRCFDKSMVCRYNLSINKRTKSE